MLPGALLTGILVRRAIVNNRALSERRLLESARVDALALDRAFAGTVGTLEALASSPMLDHEDLRASTSRVNACRRRSRGGPRSRSPRLTDGT
jgi:hypothetical protein